jgi:hypothetical protein
MYSEIDPADASEMTAKILEAINKRLGPPSYDLGKDIRAIIDSYA